jgi:PKD repeat protein
VVALRFHRAIVCFVAALLAAVLGVGAFGPAGPALADTAPPAGTPATVTADPLPTVQIDGVAWAQEIVGNRVYVGGSFTTARPAGAAPGVATTPRGNLLAYDLQSGDLDTSWAPATNAQVLTVAASPDGQRLYVGGQFTSIGGVSRLRIAAFDTATGQLVTSFNARLDGPVYAIAATNTTVYVGGSFTAANGTARPRAAAFSAANGSLVTSWRPTIADYTVRAIEISPDGSRVILGGSFTSVNGSSNPGYGLASVHPGTGASQPLPANSVLRNAGQNASVWGLHADNENFYVTAYTYYGGGTFEGVGAVRWSDGNLAWIKDCHGDSYSVHSTGDVVYSASHSHYCANLGSFGQTDPIPSWTYYRATAVTQDATRVVGKEATNYFNYEGRPGPTVLNWFPEINAGTFTGQTQGPWHVTGNAQYIVYGGEFTRVNTTDQQGLVRFAVSSVAPNAVGPRFNGTSFPIAARSIGAGAVRVSWQANADYDNEALTYRVIRDGDAAHPVWEETVPSQIWRRPIMGYTDTGLAPGSRPTYRVTVTDPFGNTVQSPTVAAVVDGTANLGAYASRVLADGASHYWRLGESAGPTVRDWAGTNDGTATNVGFGLPSALSGDPNTAGDFNAALTSRVLTPLQYLGSNYFSIEAWVRANTSERGRIAGFGNATSPTAGSSRRDRMLWIDNSGRFNFGINPRETRVITSPARYDNSAWHHVVVTMGADGVKLYVDGAKVADRPTWTTAENYFGYWSIGADSLSGWPNRPSTDYFGGRIDEVAIYPDALPASTVQQHFQIGRGLTNVAPTAAFTSTVTGLGVDVDGSASTDLDGSIVSYAWAFGDGATAGGRTTSHTYAAAGTYPVTLTVTDDRGATHTASRQVTVVDAGDAVAVDTFTRTLTNGWGPADMGGSWSLVGTTSSFSVGDGAGRMRLPSPGTGRATVLGEVSRTDVDVQVDAGLDSLPAGGSADLSVTGRRLGAGTEYRAQAKVLSSGAVGLTLRRHLSGADTALASATVPGLTYSADQRLSIRLQVTGTSPTTLAAKVWVAGTPEPEEWQVQATDSADGLQAPGSVGLAAYLSGAASNAPVTAVFDDVRVAPVP